MAYLPCAACGQRFTGETRFTYVTWYDGDEKYGFRLRHCGGCAAELRNDVCERGEPRDSAAWPTSDSPLTPAASPRLAPLGTHDLPPLRRSSPSSRRGDADSSSGPAAASA